MIVNAYYDEETEYSHFCMQDLNLIWGFGSRNCYKLLQELEKLNLIEDHTISGYFKRYKILKPTRVPKFMLNAKLTNIQKEFMLNSLQKQVKEGISNKEWSRRVYGYEDKVLRKNVRNIEDSCGKSFWEIYDCTPITIYLKPSFGTKTNFGYKGGNSISTNKIESNIISRLITRINSSAKTRGLENNLTPEYLEELLNKQNYKDYYTGLPVNENDWSVDRIDSDKGYIQGNIALTHKMINIMKNEQTIEEFKKNITVLYNNINNF